MAVSGVGAVIGGLLTSSSMRINRIGPFILLTTIGYGGIVVAFAVSHWIWLSLALVSLGSLTGSLFMSVNNTLVHMQISDEVRGRVTGVYMLTQGLFPLGVLPMAIGADLFGAPLAVAAAALLSSFGALLLALRSPALRRLNTSELTVRPNTP
jgi:MFS family permease